MCIFPKGDPVGRTRGAEWCCNWLQGHHHRHYHRRHCHHYHHCKWLQGLVSTIVVVILPSLSLLSLPLMTLVQVYYTTTPNKPLSQWDSQFVDNNKLTTISDLTPHTIYTIRSVLTTTINIVSITNGNSPFTLGN